MKAGFKYNTTGVSLLTLILLPVCFLLLSDISSTMPENLTETGDYGRERISLDKDWRFFKYDSLAKPDSLIYDVRPEVTDRTDDRVADSRPTEAARLQAKENVLKAWVLPTGNKFIKDPGLRYVRPESDPGSDFPFVKSGFDDSSWEKIDLPHDWAIHGPFMKGTNAAVGGGMGRLPVNGVAWYRKKLDIPATDKGRSIFLDIDGAMSYSIVWLNGHLVGGWPYGYNSWRLDLTSYIIPGATNQLAIRIDNPPYSSRWYPGAGIYRNVWLVKTNPVHVAQWGTFITTKDISAKSAKVEIRVTIENDSRENKEIEMSTSLFEVDRISCKTGNAILTTKQEKFIVKSGEERNVNDSALIRNPKLWGPQPAQKPFLYKAVTTLFADGRPVDKYETMFGIRSLKFDPEKGISVNGEHIPLRGVNQHHDLGALGAAFNTRAAERQLEILREMGCNAIRTAHNPPSPGLLDLADRMGFLVIDEIFDTWEQKKTPLDFHLIFQDWYEQDTRAFIRRDRNHPSVIIWSFGNEVGEQYTGEKGAAIAKKLNNIIIDEDPTRPSTSSMNYAKPDMPFPAVAEIISLNYQGEGIRDAPAYELLQGIHTSPLYASFHQKYPDKVILSSETSSTLSSRGTYLFPVYEGMSAPVSDGSGGDPVKQSVSAYEIYTSAFGASPDRVFEEQDKNPFVAGEFVWSGWDYLGEPTPYYSARSSYSGIIDLAGFKKDRFYLYQSRWRPELRIAHILPHWTWPGRSGKITPVHLFTSGDWAELFLNGKSQGVRKKGNNEYRLRWDSVKYEPGIIKAVVYKNGKKWAEDVAETAGEPAMLKAEADRSIINADGKDLSFITVMVTDSKGTTVPYADNTIEFSVEGPGNIIATDNGDPTDMVPFLSARRKAFNGKMIGIFSSERPGTFTVNVKSPGLRSTIVRLKSH